MFYDERIENEKGRISRNAIALSVILSFLIGSIRFADILNSAGYPKYLCFVTLEATIVILGSILLVIGFVLSKTMQVRDERAVSVEHRYYNKAASVLIKAVAIVYAIFLPIVQYHTSSFNHFDQSFSRILLVLLFVVGIYVVYEFRKNDIYFNYSIIENEHYYMCVFKNVGKLVLYFLCLLTVSWFSFILFVSNHILDYQEMIGHTLNFTITYVGPLIELSAIYLFYSILEKMSYKSTQWLSKSTTASLGITLFLHAVYTSFIVLIACLVTPQIDALTIVMLLSYYTYYIDFALLIFITYFSYEYLKGKYNKLLFVACITLLLSESFAFLIEHIIDALNWLLLLGTNNYDASLVLAYVKGTVLFVSAIANIIGFSLIITALIKDKLISNQHRLAIVGVVILSGIEVFLYTYADYMLTIIYPTIVELTALIYLCILVAYIRRKKQDLVESSGGDCLSDCEI